MSTIIDDFFRNPDIGFISKHKMMLKLKNGIPGVTRQPTKSELDDFYKHDEIIQRSKRVRVKKYQKITSPPNCYQIDVAVLAPDIHPWRRGGKKPAKLLVLVNILSRKAYVYTLPSGEMKHIMTAYKRFVAEVSGENSDRPFAMGVNTVVVRRDLTGPLTKKEQSELEDRPERIVKCAGKRHITSVSGDFEFKNKQIFDKFNKDNCIGVVTDKSKDIHMQKYGNKLGIVDAFIKNLKNRIRYFRFAHDTNDIKAALPKIVANYNDTPHEALHNDTPNKVHDDPVKLTNLELENAIHNKLVLEGVKLKVGDTVRLFMAKSKLDKQRFTFSKKIYKIIEKSYSKRIEGSSFRVAPVNESRDLDVNEDEQKRMAKRQYRPYQLLKVHAPDIIEAANGEKIRKAVEKVKKQRNRKREGIFD